MITNHLSRDSASQSSVTQRMQNIRQHFKNADHQHEFYIANAFNTVNFDQSFESFQRLDQLFTAFKNQIGVLDIQHDADPSQLNSLMLIASHLGQFLAERTSTPEQWFSREELKQNLPQSNVSVPESFLYDYALVLANKIVFPLLVTHQYFKQAENAQTFSQYIESEILNHLIISGEEKNKIAEEMHALQIIYQKNYPLSFGSAFQKLVEISHLDYSLQSLDRLDELMREMRQNYIVSAEKFLSDQSNFYFVLFLSGYLGRIITQHAGFLLGYVFQFIHGVLPRHDPNANIDPTSFPPGNTFIKHVDGSDFTLKQLEQNMQDYPYNVLTYEMYACLPHIRTDAISLHIRQYGEQAINLHLVVPYFLVFGYRGFQILQPYLSACDSVTEQQSN